MGADLENGIYGQQPPSSVKTTCSYAMPGGQLCSGSYIALTCAEAVKLSSKGCDAYTCEGRRTVCQNSTGVCSALPVGNGTALCVLAKSLPPSSPPPPPSSVKIDFPFVVAMLKGGSGVPGHFAIKTGNAQKAHSLHTNHDGPRPKGYAPMKKKGAIILGIGGGE